MVTRNNFENVQGWGGANEASVTTEKAHSGKSSICVNPQVEYSYTYNRTLGQMTSGKPKKLTVEGWAWVPDKNAKASVTVEIKHSPTSNSTVFYEGLDLVSSVDGFKDWKKVKKTFTLPDSVAFNNAVKVYVWRGSSPSPVYFDDMAISLEN
ncbi:carbohydrate binding domain-containing protein [Hymenobacter ruricola]|uniref:Carbohydrate binding domain-containing protein n=1 Tax=Hymenobacter ruricola TaxID=2791023 RepID=A0ABS0I9V0_9BACT|nr:carbohydrate binding domain-containing protein [Hymenobacter ruricola]MBF9223735.1 carbohydrate binding domain-containing protein [Hymenobacter ruricola]